MERGKLIVIEGTDLSGKETQSKKLIERLKKDGKQSVYYSFPDYASATGRIVGFPYLGKPYLAEEMIYSETKNIFSGLKSGSCNLEHIFNVLKMFHPEEFSSEEMMVIKESLKNALKERLPQISLEDMVLVSITLDKVMSSLSHGWFSEGAPNVDAMVSTLYYAADRKANMPIMESILNQGFNIVLDRYTYSNMGHQGGKILDDKIRKEIYEWIADLEFRALGLPQSDARIFLHMPTDYANLLKKLRAEKMDENERDMEHLYHAEKAFVEVANLYDFETIECLRGEPEEAPTLENIKNPEEISEEVYQKVMKRLTR